MTTTAAFDNAHALVVGISRYGKLREIPNGDDVANVVEALKNQTLCHYPPTQVTELHNEAATRDEILAKVKEVAQARQAVAVRAPGGQSRFFFYFSGHGYSVKEGPHCGQYLCPYEFNDDDHDTLIKTAISGPALQAELEAVNADWLTVVLDCCHAGGVLARKGEDWIADSVRPEAGVSITELKRLGKGRNWVILAASDNSEAAYAGNGRSVFTRHLVDGLRGRAPAAGGVIRIFQLFDYIAEKVHREQPGQNPRIIADTCANFDVAAFRGGAVGTGEGVARGLGLLLERLRDQDVRGALDVMRNRLRDVGSAIGVVSALKDVHDRLHKAQVQGLDPVLVEVGDFPYSSRAQVNLSVHADALGDDYKKLNELRVKLALPLSMDWMTTFDRAVRELQEGVKALDRHKVNGAIGGLRTVLGQQPTQVNGALVSAIRTLPLGDLAKAMRSVIPTPGAAVGEPDAGQRWLPLFEDSCTDLDALDNALQALLSEHDGWQGLDFVLRTASDALERMAPAGAAVPDDFGFLWTDLDRIIGKMTGAPRAASARNAADAVNRALGTQVLNATALRVEFAKFRRRSIEAFYEVDTELRAKCRELDRICDPIAMINKDLE